MSNSKFFDSTKNGNSIDSSLSGQCHISKFIAKIEVPKKIL